MGVMEVAAEIGISGFESHPLPEDFNVDNNL